MLLVLFGDNGSLHFFGAIASVVALFYFRRVFMDCENEFCIYQKDDKCTLDKISLDFQGICNECIYVNLDNELLEELKKKQIK